MVRSFTKTTIIFVLFVLSLYAGNDEELFLRGNKLYGMGQYSDAISSYELIPKKGRAVWYNMGNAYYHDGNYIQALLYWKRARKGACLSECRMIDHNCNCLLKKVGRSSEISSQWYVYLLDNVYCYSSLYTLQLLFLLLWFAFVAVLYYYRFSRKFLSALLSVLIIIVGIVLYGYYAKAITTEGIIVQDKVSLFSGPNKAFYQVGQIKQFDYVTIKETREGWHKVRYSDKIGWIDADAVQII